jgi:hypothetical protein
LAKYFLLPLCFDFTDSNPCSLVRRFTIHLLTLHWLALVLTVLTLYRE